MTHTTKQELYEQWKEDYALTFEPNYNEHLEADCKAAFLAGMQAARRCAPQWKVVPVEPTEKMISEGSCAQTLEHGHRYIGECAAKTAWSFMLAVAPQPPEGLMQGNSATKQELATGGQVQADVPDERKAFDAANLRDHFGDPLSYRERDIAFRAWQARAALAATQPVAQGLDAPNEWEDIRTLPTCDDLIWLYCKDTNTTDGPIAPEPSLEQYGWTHWAYANAPSTAWIDAAQAKKEGEKK